MNKQAFYKSVRSGILNKPTRRISQSFWGAAVPQITFPSSSIGEMIGRRADCSFYAMPAFKAHVYGGRRYSENTTSGSDARVCNTIYCNGAERPFVLGNLLKASSPTAVIRRIPLRWIEAINRMIETWPLAHISQERGERFTPPIANHNPLRPIFGEVLKLWVPAPSLHAEPYFIRGTSIGLRPVAMFKAAVRFIHVNCISSPTPKGNNNEH